MKYSPPSTDDLIRLKADRQSTGEQMAELAGLGGSNQWRKYTGGKAPRTMGLSTAFYLAASLELSEEEMNRVFKRMASFGALVDR